ncbi:MAG: hypothetical protein ISS28_00130 [Candidatus Cloacimonetes bacterium]|nr:hypothetical protein [Candidatus Cloacimonadota bacterium]MBL7085494.1 hypothetical protein [Candidatus Cloacimonadota bacterium]
MSLFQKLIHIDRRIIFILIFFGTAVPLLLVLNLPVEVTKNVKNVYKMVEETPEGSPVIISFDYDPSTKPEIQPMAVAIIQQSLRNKLKLICIALWPMGVQLCNEAFEQVLPLFPEVKYGIDYVNLGYKAGGMVTINHMAKDLPSTFPTDAGGIPIDEFPIMKGINNFSKIGFVVGLSAGDPGLKQWVMVVHDAYGRPVAGGSTAVQVPYLLPYVNEQQQLTGLVGGLKGAAEYEKLINQPGFATKGMDAQSVAHLIIILLIVIGNVGFFITKRTK